MTTQEAKEEKPLYLGHRERLRKRFLKDDGFSMDDYEVLELLLTYAIPRRDVKPLAKQLLAAYQHDLGAVLHADPKMLAEKFKIGEMPVALFKLVNTCAARMASACFSDRKTIILSNLDSVVEFCRHKMAYLDVEEFRVFYLDQQYHYIGEELLSRGTINRTHVYSREFFRHAIDAKAMNVILCHNHPNGDCKPSEEDKVLTKNLCEELTAVDISIVDHLIVTRNDYFSFSLTGLIPNSKVQEQMRAEKRKKMLAK
ncbi:MAG: DNA repair protein RadC [Alphaproteobacteria bacterium]|nr:DNA repair protein RadC [Alphaproteobacteria bacterium]